MNDSPTHSPSGMAAASEQPAQPGRRQLLGLLGASSAAGLLLSRSALTQSSSLAKAATCTLTAAMTEGPYFVDERLHRSDLTTGTTLAAVTGGRPLTLTLLIQSAGSSSCKPLRNVQIDLWHANVLGNYSDVGNQLGQTYLRGYQLSDDNGRVTFHTIFPGWYPGRAVHLHVKARVFSATGNVTYQFNTQLFFDDSQTDQIYALAPYSSRPNRSTRNAQDNIYAGHSELIVPLEDAGDGSNGLTGTITLGLQLPAELATVDLDQHGLTGFWFNPDSSGQGLGLEIYPDAMGSGIGLLAGGWYTFDETAGGAEQQRWYFLSGPVNQGAAVASLKIYRNSAGNFAAAPATSAVLVGAATLVLASCDQGVLSYAFSDGSQRSGSIALTRLLPNRTCVGSGESPPADTDFGMSGLWFNPQTAGQGLMVELNSAARYAFIAWYTYAVNGQASGVAAQRWYSAQGQYNPGARTLNLTLYQTTGGRFSLSQPATFTQAVGSATLSFSDCDNAVLSYAFDSGANTGQMGSIELQRTGAAPASCAFGAG